MSTQKHSTVAKGVSARIQNPASSFQRSGWKRLPLAGVLQIALFVTAVLGVTLNRASGQTYGASAYIKASNNAFGLGFGEALALDGDRLAISVPFSRTYLFERSGSRWRETQVIEPILRDSELTLSLAGSTLALGWQRNGSADASNPTGTTLKFSGAVRVLDRDASGVYRQTAFLKSPKPAADARFGQALAVDGDTLAIGERGAVHIYQRAAGTWTFSSTLPLPPGTPVVFGWTLDLSGSRLVVGAPFEGSGFSGVNPNLSDVSKPSSGAAYIYVREGNVWRFEAALKASNPDPGDEFGRLVAISGDTVAITAPMEASAATGIGGNQSDNSATRAGATYVFERSPVSGAWSQVAYVKRPVTGDAQFSNSLALDGALLAIGTPGDDSNARTVNGNPANTAAANSGSVHLYHRIASGWVAGDYLKAPNADRTDQFGYSLAVSGTTVAAGANQEASGSREINSGLDSNDQRGAGAAYVFTPGGTLEENIVLPEIEFLSALAPADAIPVDEGGTSRDILIRRTTSNGALTVHFRLASSSEVDASEIALRIDRGASNLTSNNGLYSLVIPNGTADVRLLLTVVPDPTDQAEAAEAIHFEFVANEAYTIAAGKNVTHFSSTAAGSLVTNTADSGTGSLRQALLNANSNTNLTTVTFSNGQGGSPNFFDGTHRTISLSSELLIDEDTILEGPGKCFLTLTGNSDGDMVKEPGETRIFRLSSKGGGGFVAEEIVIRGLTIRDGIAQNSNAQILTHDNAGGLVLIDNRETIATIDDCTLIGGRAGLEGGAVSNESSSLLTVVDCDIVDCHAGSKGGALFINARATLLRCHISGNSAADQGGGIYVDNSDSTVIRECLVSNNTAEGSTFVAGGGIFVGASIVVIADCHIVGNRAIARHDPAKPNSGSAQGGGISYSTGVDPKPQLLVNTTIADNLAFGDSGVQGGGISLFVAPIPFGAEEPVSPFRIHSCAFIGNRAVQSGIGLPYDRDTAGGGIHISAATLGTLLDNCTISGNEAEEASGISILNGRGIVIDLYQSIVSGNIGEDLAGTNLSNPPRPRGRVASAGYNLVGTGAFGADFTAAGDRIGITDPGITRLRFHGGRFPTYTLAPGSPARDAGDPTPEHDKFLFSAVWLDNLLETDQRRNGFARIIGGRTDIGSIEFDPATPEIVPPRILSLREKTLTFTSIPGRHYILEVSSDLTYFIRLNKPFSATSTRSALTDPTPTGNSRSRFYRISEVPML